MKIKTIVDFETDRATLASRFRDPDRVAAVLSRQRVDAVLTNSGRKKIWRCSVNWRGQAHAFDLVHDETVENETFVMSSASKLADIVFEFDFYDMPDRCTRIITNATIEPRSIATRVALQSMRLIPGRLNGLVSRLTRALGQA